MIIEGRKVIYCGSQPYEINSQQILCLKLFCFGSTLPPLTNHGLK